MGDDTGVKSRQDARSTRETRRRLLKASAAAPLIATLGPRAALAQGSLTCATKGLEDTALQTSLPVTASDDNAVRRLGTCWEKNNRPTVWEVPKGTGQYYSSDGGLVPMEFPSGFVPRDCYFLEFFSVQQDGSVQRVGTYPQPATGSVLADSCWASIAIDGQFTIN